MGRKIEGYTNAAMDRLVSHVWSGNVRELENEIERTVALAGDATTISADMLSENIRGAPPGSAADPVSEAPGDLDLNRAVDSLKQRLITHALREAAERLGIPRQSLQKMMKRLGLKDEE
jgi:transcriptional regulator with PAS, ATPase and Fis domain